jgi:hypothetical protein
VELAREGGDRSRSTVGIWIERSIDRGGDGLGYSSFPEASRSRERGSAGTERVQRRRKHVDVGADVDSTFEKLGR